MNKKEWKAKYGALRFMRRCILNNCHGDIDTWNMARTLVWDAFEREGFIDAFMGSGSYYFRAITEYPLAIKTNHRNY